MTKFGLDIIFVSGKFVGLSSWVQ